MTSIFLFVLLTAFVRVNPLLPSIAGKLNKVLFVYPFGVQSERDLAPCPENSACNVIHRRFWLPPIVERLCKCPRRHDCTWTWSEETDNLTMTLDNRSQIKVSLFCEELQLPKCTIKKPALRLVVEFPKIESDTSAAPKPRASSKSSRHLQPKNVTAFCNCHEPHYWKLKPNSTRLDDDTGALQQTYFCSKLNKCSALEFCGYVRTDTYSTFYRCSCPNGHLCISKDKTLFDVEELMFKGHGYKAFCFPVRSKRPPHSH